MTTVRLGSSLRCCSVEETLRRAMPLMAHLGISRVAEITRMDRLGLPVFASIRPRGRTLRVHAGKGVAAPDARVGALMEAVEFAVADPGRTPWDAKPMAVGRFLEQLPRRTDLMDFAPILGRRVTVDDVMVTVRCESVRTGAPLHLPAELVFLPFEEPEPIFGWSSNGLASGNSVEEATLHGLLEVIERDAVSLNRAADQSRWVDPESFPEPLRGVVAAWRHMDIHTAVRWLPASGALGVHCFQACVHEPGRASVHLASGNGAHPDPGIALTRAVCEAAQSRLSHVHGGRDDIVHFYANFAKDDERSQKDALLLPRWFDSSAALQFDELKPLATSDDIGGLLAGLIDHLEGAGFEHVFRHVFAIDLNGLAVVRVIVPGCEDAENSPWRMGRRLFAQVTGAAWP